MRKGSFFYEEVAMKTLLLILFASSVPVFAQETPDVREISIKNLQYAGTGCPQNSVSTDLSEDGEAMTLIFSAYQVEKGTASKPLERKNCNIRLAMNTPAGWSFALLSLIFRGYADIDKSATGVQNVNYSLGAGSPKIKLGKMKIDGEFKNDYERADTLPISTIQWSPCRNRSQVLELDTAIAIASNAGSPEAGGYMTVDSLDGELSQQYELLWKRCDVPQHPNRKSFAMCKTELRKREDQSLVREIMAKAYGRNDQMALTKARTKTDQKCRRFENRRQNLYCVTQTTVCTASPL